MGVADVAFAVPELRGEIMAQRARGMARDHARSLRGRGAPGVHRRSVRCEAGVVRGRGSAHVALGRCTENVALAAVAHGRRVCNKCLPGNAFKLNGTARWTHVDFMDFAQRRERAMAFWRARP